MTKVGDINILNAILCDDIRQEFGNNKLILIGVYSGDVVLSQIPAEILMAFYVELQAPVGRHEIEIRLSGPQKGEGIFNATFESEGSGIGTLASPRIGINMAEEGTFRIDFRKGEGRWVNIISKKIILSPNALPRPSAQSLLDVQETS